MQERSYSQVSQAEGKNGPAEAENGQALVKKTSSSASKKMKNEKKAGALMVLDELQSEHITNLALFGLDRSDGELNWKWRSVGELISECNDPARPPVKGCNKKFFHWKLRRVVENIYFRIFTFLLILLDISLVIAEIYISCSWNPVSIIIRHIDLILSIYFVIEVFLRIIALTPKVFFSRASWHNIVDFFVVILAFAATIAAMVIIANIDEEEKEVVDGHVCEKSEESTGKKFSFIVVVRFIRIFRFVRLLRIYFEHRNVVKSVRQRISENKRRFQVDGYDLDLTYILTNVIAMSFPSKGTKALYRNKIDNVAKFFEDKYSDERHIDYMLYNLCSEMEYDHRKFHGNVRRFEIDDHNVPSLEQMFELVDDVKTWLQGGDGRERVVALHCKGGKGRTGTMICAILIDKGLFKEAGDTLQYFGQRRTDLNVSEQFQGVETYSQIRYVHYFQTLNQENIREVPSRPLVVKTINITGLNGVGRGDGSDFTLTIFNAGAKVLTCDFKSSSDCDAKYDPKTDQLEVSLKSPPTVNKDTKFMFHCSSKGVPKAYDDCAFFFWLHTYFIKDLHEVMFRQHLDNPHKEKTWRVWRENFSVEVVFGQVE
eukprot:TRINITY_DN6927_c0_g1_i6.p1 TRINITY_DN6927_c0_g1~~TRINITY_DN6927_c0_g1_i6.p1  ORF type:complete len:599 (-),score=158.90 TRINITY_DN6927_c0_g1_i6:76-1872(-)